MDVNLWMKRANCIHECLWIENQETDPHKYVAKWGWQDKKQFSEGTDWINGIEKLNILKEFNLKFLQKN